jgi:5-(carboxyamino)imidazole ribonucleotide synthase
MIGILGGGQLGCMLAESLSEPFMFFDPDPMCPAASKGYKVVTAPWNDLQAIENFALQSRRLTYESENIPASTLDALQPFESVCIPSLDVLKIFQNRKLEKQFILENGLPAVPHVFVSSQRELDALVFDDWILKTLVSGYDGKGQMRKGTESQTTWDQEFVCEKVIENVREASCVLARDPKGHVSVFPIFENHHKTGILDHTVVPARLDFAMQLEMITIAKKCAEILNFVGVLTVEFFIDSNNGIYINEFAPRPHNSGHITRVSTDLSQFELLARILEGAYIPNAPVNLRHSHQNEKVYYMKNLIGSDSFDANAIRNKYQGNVGKRELVFYGKKVVKPGRKMGHVSFAFPDYSEVDE